MQKNHRRLLQKKVPSMTIIEKSTAAGLKIYPNVWKRYFQRWSILVLVEIEYSTSYAMLDVSNSTHIVILQCNTNKINQDKTSTMVNGIMKTASVLLKKSNQIKVIITGLLLWDKNLLLH